MSFDEMISRRLNQARPERYQSFDWVDEVAESIDIEDIDVTIAVREWVRSKCRKAEGSATKSGNRLFRDFHKTGQMPLEWESIAKLPISLENRRVVDGKARLFKERVKLGSATTRDFDLWAIAENEAADRDHAARLEAVAGARAISARMKRAGVITFAEWARTVPLVGDDEGVA